MTTRRKVYKSETAKGVVTTVAIPDSLRQKIKKSAVRNQRTLGGEIRVRLQASIEADHLQAAE